MVKARCVWCEDSDAKSTSGYYWIHLNCVEKLMDYRDDIKSIKEILQGTHLRNKKDEDKLKLVCEFIEDMENFRKRWEGTMKFIKEVGKVDFDG